MEVFLGEEVYDYKWIIPNILKVSDNFRIIQSLNTPGKCVPSLVVLLPANPEQHSTSSGGDKNESNRKQLHHEKELLLNTGSVLLLMH